MIFESRTKVRRDSGVNSISRDDDDEEQEETMGEAMQQSLQSNRSKRQAQVECQHVAQTHMALVSKVADSKSYRDCSPYLFLS